MTRGRRFHIRTYGCQMNVHDTEKLANLLHHHGWRSAEAEDADLLLINTCSVRDRAEQRLYSDLGRLRPWKAAAPGRLIGVGGCVAQQEGEALLRRCDQLDFVFGTHNLRLVPSMIEGAWTGQREARTEERGSRDRFELPERHPDYAGGSPGRAYVTVMEGCDMFCSFCIVPLTRGREISRGATEIQGEVRTLAERGVREIILLGQTVNAYGRHDLRRGRAVEEGVTSFGSLIESLAGIPGIERIRYTSPHPIFFDDALVRAHGEVEALCPHVHLPVQSGSDPVLAQMGRRYTAQEYLAIPRALRRARPDIAITTDLIVGFPGESDADFEATLELVRQARFTDSFSFKYSPRPGTRAAQEPPGEAVPPDLAQERLEILQSLQRDLTLAAHQARVGARTEVRVEGPSRHGGSQLMGRDPYHRVVNLDAKLAGLAPERAGGQFVAVEIVEATPHSLIGVPLGASLPIEVKEPELRGIRGVKEAPLRADEEERPRPV